MRPLIINQEIENQIKELVTYAEENPCSMDYLLDMANGVIEPVGNSKGHYALLPFGYKVVYSIELQPIGRIRHLSMSVNIAEKLPSVVAVQEIMKLLGFENELENCKVALEPLSPNHNAINILELMDGLGSLKNTNAIIVDSNKKD